MENLICALLFLILSGYRVSDLQRVGCAMLVTLFLALAALDIFDVVWAAIGS